MDLLNSIFVENYFHSLHIDTFASIHNYLNYKISKK